MKTQLIFSLPPGPLQIGLIEADAVKIGLSRREYLVEIEKAIKGMASLDYVYPDNLQKGIRSLLKAYGFHASGRNRPASEFLVKDLQNRGTFNAINNAVDINNHLSLVTHLPISILDREKCGDKLCLRLGCEGESYVFNREGHELSLKHLLTIAKGDHTMAPCGSPVKDSQATKVFETTTSLVGVVYTSKTITPENDLRALMQRFEELLRREAHAEWVAWQVLDSPT